MPINLPHPAKVFDSETISNILALLAANKERIPSICVQLTDNSEKVFSIAEVENFEEVRNNIENFLKDPKNLISGISATSLFPQAFRCEMLLVLLN